MTIKAHLAIPEELLAEIDRFAGKRKRSLFIVEAAREKIEKERFKNVLEATSGAWSDDKHPELKTAANVERYVREKRQQYRKRQKRTGHE